MITHQDIVNELSDELFADDNVLALILYGSVARQEQSPNSDIDLLVVIRENYLQKRHIIRYDITVEFVEISLEFLNKHISERKTPMVFALAQGVVLFNKSREAEQLIDEAKKIIESGPSVNERWNEKEYSTKKRSDLTEIYKDLLDTDDEINFNYIVSALITSALPMLYENYNLWPQSKKKTMDYLKAYCHDGYKIIEILLSSKHPLREKRNAAKDLINFTLKEHGGVLEGETTIFKITEL